METKTTHTVDLSTDERGVMFNPDEEAKAAGWGTDDPYVCLAKLYDGPPVVKGVLEDLMGIPRQYDTSQWGSDVYSVLSYEAVNKAFLDPETFSNRVYDKMSVTALGDTLLNMDGGKHKRMRNVSKPWFKPSFTDGWWTDKWIVEAVDELFERLIAKGPCRPQFGIMRAFADERGLDRLWHSGGRGAGVSQGVAVPRHPRRDDQGP